MGIFIFGVVFILTLVGYAFMSQILATDKWYLEGKRDAHKIFKAARIIPKVPDLSGHNYKKEYIDHYTKGFEKGIEEIYEQLNMRK